jgi:hypothetical protein
MVPDNPGVITFSGPCVQLGVASSFRANVPLPQGSTITHVSFSFKGAGAGTTSFTLFRSVLTGTNNTIVPSTPVATGDGTLNVDVNPPVVVGPGEGVYARAVLDATAFACGVEITYTPPAP